MIPRPLLSSVCWLLGHGGGRGERPQTPQGMDARSDNRKETRNSLTEL